MEFLNGLTMGRRRFSALAIPRSGLRLSITNNGDGTATWRIAGYGHPDSGGHVEIYAGLLGGNDLLNTPDIIEQFDFDATSGTITINDPSAPYYFAYVAHSETDEPIEGGTSNVVGPYTITNDADATDWNTRITSASGAGDLADLQDYVATTKVDGVWSKHILMLHGWNVAAANLVRSNGATVATYQGTLTHSSNTMTTNGTNNALRTGLIPNDTGWFGQFFYKTSTTASSTGVDFGAATTSPAAAVTLFNVNFSGGLQADYGGNSTTQRQTTTGQTLAGLYMSWTPDGATARASRSTSGGTTALVSTAISGSQPKPQTELSLGAYNINGTLGNYIAGSYNCSGIMTASLTTTERDDLIAAIITLLLARGWIT